MELPLKKHPCENKTLAMDANLNESPDVRDPHNKFESFYHDMDSGYQSFEVKNSSITMAATHSTPVKKCILPDLSAGFTISRGLLLHETIDEEVPSIDTPKKRKCSVPNTNSLPKKLKPYSSHRTKLTSSLKRKLIPEDNKPKYIPTNEGRSYMDFIAGLNDGYSKVLREIFRLLSPEDLHNMSLVCRTWSAIINEDTQKDLKVNLKDFRHKLSDSKENLNVKCKDCKEDDFVFQAKKPFSMHNKMKKKELKRANTLAGGELFASPSKKAAIKSEWLMPTISNQEETTSCPHCSKVSRISVYKSKTSQTPSYINSLNGFMSYTNPTSLITSHFYDSPESSPSSQSSPGKAEDPNIPLVKYGECTNAKCKFKFCLECSCEFHEETPCILTNQVSPSKEEMENGILQAIYSPSSSCSTGETASKRKNTAAAMKKRAKKSLKRLCF